MPVPIRCLPDYFKGQGEDSRPPIDYSFLFDNIQNPSSKRTVVASNQDATTIYEIWLNGDKTGEYKYKITNVIDNRTVSSKDIVRLKTRGFITGSSDEIEFTSKGKSIITTMSLGEHNKFLKDKKSKSYSEILASMNKRGKKGYRMASTGEGSPKFLADNSNSLDLRNI